MNTICICIHVHEWERRNGGGDIYVYKERERGENNVLNCCRSTKKNGEKDANDHQ